MAISQFEPAVENAPVTERETLRPSTPEDIFSSLSKYIPKQERSLGVETSGDEETKKLFAFLSKAKQEQVLARETSYRLSNMPEEVIKKFHAEDVRMAHQVYENLRYGKEYHSKEGGKKTLRDRIEYAFNKSSEEGAQTLARIARVTIDLNGLKAINDLAGHDKGDVFLKRMMEKMKVVAEIISSEFNINVLSMSADGGDEAGFVIESDEIITQEIGEAIQKRTSDQFRESCSDLLSNEQIMKELKLDTLPEGYEFKSSAAVGLVTLNEALLSEEAVAALRADLERKKKNRKNGELTSDDLLDSMMGRALDVSDELMIADKKEIKRELDPVTQELLSRNDETRELIREKRVLEEKITKIQEDLTNCIEARRVLSTKGK